MNSTTPILARNRQRIANIRGIVNYHKAQADMEIEEAAKAYLRAQGYEFPEDQEPEPQIVINLRGRQIVVSEPTCEEQAESVDPQYSMFDADLNPTVSFAKQTPEQLDQWLEDVLAGTGATYSPIDDDASVTDLLVDDAEQTANAAVVYGFGALQKATLIMMVVFFVIAISRI